MQTPVQKTLLKFYAYELIERVTRFDMLTREIWREHRKISNKSLEALEAIRNEMNETVATHKSQLHQLLSDETAKKQAGDVDALLQWGRSLTEHLRTATAALTALIQPTATQELELLTVEAFAPPSNNGTPDELTKVLGDLSLTLGQELSAEDTLEPVAPKLSGVSFSRLSVLQRNNPLGWASGLNDFLIRAIEENSTHFKKIKKQLSSITSNENEINIILASALGLKIIGPAYYFQTLADGLVQQNELTLCHIEPVLFFGLNHYNTIEKSLIIAHESVDKTLPAFNMDSAETLWTHELLAGLYGDIDRLIPDRYTFSEKAFETAKKLKERVAEGVLLSSTSCYTIQQLQEQLDEVRAKGDDYSVYDVLGKTTEFPHTGKEIINAGWLHKMDRLSVWLYAVCEESLKEPGEPDGLTRLSHILSRQDQLLLKSLDNAEVHRVLAYQL